MEDWDQTVFDLAGRKQGILRAFNKIQEKSDWGVERKMDYSDIDTEGWFTIKVHKQ